jgi:hypothetical protein
LSRSGIVDIHGGELCHCSNRVPRKALDAARLRRFHRGILRPSHHRRHGHLQRRANRTQTGRTGVKPRPPKVLTEELLSEAAVCTRLCVASLCQGGGHPNRRRLLRLNPSCATRLDSHSHSGPVTDKIIPLTH